MLILTIIYYFSDLTIKDSVFGNLSKDPESKRMIRNMAEAQWDSFLINRSRELAPGKINSIDA